MSNAEWLAAQKANALASQFIKACSIAGIIPGIRQAAQWRSGMGKALETAWSRWPKSKTLPVLKGLILYSREQRGKITT
jgi:hypothetical protein